jgi:UDP-2,3-diacylglucosamine pyrophosphatase LpxH
VVCGHIHTPDIRQIGDIHYLNDGDWVEAARRWSSISTVVLKS